MSLKNYFILNNSDHNCLRIKKSLNLNGNLSFQFYLESSDQIER